MIIQCPMNKNKKSLPSFLQKQESQQCTGASNEQIPCQARKDIMFFVFMLHLPNHMRHLISKLKSVALVFGFFCSFYLNASVQEDYAKANEWYTNGNYTEAINTYKKLLETQTSDDIHYNLANAYYKNNEITSAILHYEKALQINPSHEDASFNLGLANQRTIDKIETIPEGYISSSWDSLVTTKSTDGWAYYTIVFLFLSTALLISYLLVKEVMLKKSAFYAGIIGLVLALFTWLLAAQHYHKDQNSTAAIVFTPTVAIKSEPTLNAEKLFTLHEGTKVALLEKIEQWYKIKLPNGNIGWIKTTDVEPI